MSSFRLARLLSLREDQAKAEKIRWALAQRAAREAAEQADASRERAAAAQGELSDANEQGETRPGNAMGATIAAYETLDALNERVGHDDEALAEARRRAFDALAPYDERRRQVEALRRLEERWSKEQRRTRRRKENREREAFINGQSRPITKPAPQAEEAQGA